LVVAIFGVYVLLLLVARRRWVMPRPALDYAKAGWLCLVGVVPWLVLVGWFAGPERFIRHRYEVSMSNWLSPELATGYLQQLPLQLSWPVLILIALSLIYSVIYSRNTLFVYMLVWFSVFYVFFTGDGCIGCIGYDRFALVLFLPLAVWMGVFVGGIIQVKAVRWLGLSLSLALVGYLVLVSTLVRVPPLGPQYASYLDAAGNVPPAEASAYWKEKVNGASLGTSYLPAGQVFHYFKDQPQRAGKILIWDQQRMQFYAYKHEFDLDLYECSETVPECKFETKEQLLSFARDNGINYLLLPVGHGYTGIPLWEQILNAALGRAFEEANYKPFELVERFDHGDQGLLLLRAPT
jgi:hypothetical protein